MMCLLRLAYQFVTAASLCCGIVQEVSAQEPAPLFSSETRGELEEEVGISFEGYLLHDFVQNMGGGLKRDFGQLGDLELITTFDLEKLASWEGGSAGIFLMGNYGDNPSSFVGDLQYTSNIQARDRFRLYEAWIKQSLLDDRVSALVGLRDFVSDFLTLDTATYFVQSSFRGNPEYTFLASNIWPASSFGGVVRASPFESYYIQAGVYDGRPEDPAPPWKGRIRFSRADGVLSAQEFGFGDNEAQEKLALGAWQLTSDFVSPSGAALQLNHGFYFMGERELVPAGEDGTQRVRGFFQSGWAPGDRNQVHRYLGGGLLLEAPCSSRPYDVLGLAFAHMRQPGAYRLAMPGAVSAETAIELTYRLQLTSAVVLQPDLQWVINPGAVEEVSDAWVGNLRVEVSL